MRASESAAAARVCENAFVIRSFALACVCVCSVAGAGYFTWALNAGMTPMQRRLCLLVVTMGWVVNSYIVGKAAEAAHEAAGDKALV